MITDQVQAILDKGPGGGLLVRGGFHPEPAEEVPSLPDGRQAQTVLVIGNAGPDLWATFAATQPRDAGRNPLDDWLSPILRQAAANAGAHPVLACDGPPYAPIQRWAMCAEPVNPSPLGILIHPDHGLWHAYRAAFLFPDRLELPAFEPRPRPCDSCAEKPCLHTCPVDAFSADGFDGAACLSHLDAAAGAECRDGGCLARRACPVGRESAYPRAAGAFHQAAVRRSLRRYHAASGK